MESLSFTLGDKPFELISVARKLKKRETHINLLETIKRFGRNRKNKPVLDKKYLSLLFRKQSALKDLKVSSYILLLDPFTLEDDVLVSSITRSRKGWYKVSRNSKDEYGQMDYILCHG